jgi:hypothetical protein
MSQAAEPGPTPMRMGRRRTCGARWRCRSAAGTQWLAIVTIAGVLAPAAPIAAQPAAGLPEVALLCSRLLAGKVALVGPTREYVQSLALMALQASRTEMFERAGALVAKVLRGARPADVPVEEPTRYELFLSESAAKALGLTIPASVRARARGGASLVPVVTPLRRTADGWIS